MNKNTEPKTKKLVLNTAIFFTILLWLAVYFILIKNHLLGPRLTLPVWTVIIGVQLLIFLLARFLVPLFELVLKVTGKIGAFIFGVITTLVYYFILTPIALFKRITGPPLLNIKIDKTKDSYYEEWESSASVEKQY